MIELLDLLRFLWSVRPCFACGQLGACGHREPDVELALYEAEQRRHARAVGAPPVTAQTWLPGFAPEEYRVQ